MVLAHVIFQRPGRVLNFNGVDLPCSVGTGRGCPSLSPPVLPLRRQLYVIDVPDLLFMVVKTKCGHARWCRRTDEHKQFLTGL